MNLTSRAKGQAWYFGWRVVQRGSQFSGNYGHKGRKGQRGGSLPGGGHSAIGVTPAMSREEIEQTITQHREAQAAKKKRPKGPMAEEARTLMIFESIKLDHAIKKERQQSDLALARLTQFRKKNIVPLENKLNGMTYGTDEFADTFAEITRLENGEATDLWNEHMAHMGNVREYQQQLRELGMKHVAVPKDQQANVQLDFGKLRKGKQEAQEAVDAFNQLVGTGTVNNETARVVRVSKRRAHYVPQSFTWRPEDAGAVGLSTSSGKITMLHELGHWLEDRDPAIHQKALAFLDRRTVGETAQWLGDLTKFKGYKKHEIAKPDKFSMPYMGKVYDSETLGRYATEIVSMGIQEMFDPVSFAKADPDYFDFMYDLLRGR